MPSTLEASIRELLANGDGLAVADVSGERRAIFVPGVLRGERVRVEVDFRSRPARGTVLSILEASTHRVPPACPYVERCGGCDWMHIHPDERLAEHARIVSKLLGAPVDRSWAAPYELRYRTRARVHVESKRGSIIVGMFGRRSHTPVLVPSCVVLAPPLDRLRAALPAWLEGARGRGEARLALGADAEPRRAVFDLQWTGDPLPPGVFGRLERAIANGELAGARIFSGDVRVPAAIGDPTPFVRGGDDAPLRLAPGGFSQATEEGNVVLARRVAELARALRPGPCVELYAGAGNLTVLLARDREVLAVESDAAACKAARDNLRERTLAARVVEHDAATFTIPKATRLVVLDPPREGARAVALGLAARAGRKAPTVLYVACDPPTLARDVATMTNAGYVLRTVETFEMFPQTSHVETIVVLEPPAS